MNILKKLTERINEVCPIHGLQVVDEDPRNWLVDYSDEATDEQKTAAAELLASIDLDAVRTDVEAEDAEEQRLKKIVAVQTKVLDAVLDYFDKLEESGRPVTPKLAAVLEKWRQINS